MKKIILSAIVLFFGINASRLSAQPYSVPDSIATYVNFLKTQKYSAKEYILNLFNDYDIIIFGERTHDEMTQYHLLKELFSDERFYNQVGNIFMEMGGSNFDAQINDYLFSENLSVEKIAEEAREIQRNAMWYPLWERYNYHFLLTSLYEINQNLPLNKKLKLHPTDIAVNWQELKTSDDIILNSINKKVQDGRDSVMAENIISYIEKEIKLNTNRKKYFIILNSPHAANGIYSIYKTEIKSAAAYLFERFPNTTANVLINFENSLNMISTTSDLPETMPIDDGKLDAAFEYLGLDDLGFDLLNSPLGKQNFENMIMKDPKLTNEQIFTGFVFYKSFPKHEHINGVQDIVNEEFLPELKRRYELWGQIIGTHSTETELKKNNIIKKKNPVGLTSYWQKVMYWSGGGKTILSFHQKSESIEKTIEFILAERDKGSKTEYSVGEPGINTFGYELMQQDMLEDSRKILFLNTKLYPNAPNTWDSYGEILLKLNRREEAGKAYQKALELNPENEYARAILKDLKE